MGRLSDRVNQLVESETIKMSRISRELIAEGKDVISLSLGEPDFVTPQHILDAAKKAIDDGFTFYPPISGYADLRKAISEKLLRENNLTYAPDQIVVSTGAKQSIANVVLSLINPGDEIIIPTPFWVSYSEILKLAGGIPIYIHTKVEDDFKFTAEQLRSAITPKTRMLIFSSPCNPTGTVYSAKDLQKISEVIAENPGMMVISDEIYEHINFIGTHNSIAINEKIKDQVLIVNGVSKGYAMTGWRIGYLAAPKWVAVACDKMQGQFTSAASSIAQKAALSAISSPLDATKKMCSAFLKRRDLVLELLKQIPGLKTNTPLGAFYVFPDVTSFFGKTWTGGIINNAHDLTMYLLREAHVALVSGEAFGDPNCIRISYAASEDTLRKAMERVKKSLAILQPATTTEKVIS